MRNSPIRLEEAFPVRAVRADLPDPACLTPAPEFPHDYP